MTSQVEAPTDNSADRAFWAGRNVFVTGCSGFLGSWLARRLVDLGAEVTGLVRDLVPKSSLNGDRGVADRINIVRGAMEDQQVLERALNEYSVDTVFHLGAQAIVGTANRNPVSTFEANIRGTWNLLDSCRRVDTVKAVLVASSDKAYGTQEVLPYTEDMPLQGRYPYDVSKSCTDLIAQCYNSTYGLPVCVTRCGNFFGGGDLNFNRIIPGTIRSVLEGKAPVIRSDGTFIRDYIYVRDVVSAYLLLAVKMRKMEISGQTFNFSNEIQLTVLELTGKILGLMGREDLRPVILNEARGEIKHQYLSSRKAREVLGWRSTYTMDEALLETIEWYKDFFRSSDAPIHGARGRGVSPC